MNVRNLFKWFADPSEGWGQDIKERRDFYLYRFLPVCSTLFIGSLLLQLSTKSSLLATKTIQGDLIYLALGLAVGFFGCPIYFVAGTLLISQISPKRDN